MPQTIIDKKTNDATIDIVLDTLEKKKQALVFVNSKRSAEKTAEEISKKVNEICLQQFSEKVLGVLPRPTKQCERLANCVKQGIAFHHAGLHHLQKEMVEDAFREGKIKIICCTPTLAYGLSIPAYRAILKDLRRYSGSGLNWIPTLEFLQMAGRAGRPEFDNLGEAIAIAKTKAEKEEIEERYIKGKPEQIFSKLAVEPVLRTYLLSLISSDFVRTKKQILDFFRKTFWAYQFKDMARLEFIIEKMLMLLEDFEFIKISSSLMPQLSVDPTDIKANRDDFVSADELDGEKITATIIGRRTAQLYIDPLTAYHFICCLRRAMAKKPNEFSFLQMISHTIEMRPLLRVKVKEFDDINRQLIIYEPWLLDNVPNLYGLDYDGFLCSVKTTLMLMSWVNENDEDFILHAYGVRPGELHVKVQNADWLLYTAEELAGLLGFQKLIKHIVRMRYRLKYGVKEELLPLLQLKQIGRVRARKLFNNRIKTLGELRKVDINTLSRLIGDKTASYIKEQLGQTAETVKKNKRKGQINITDYRDSGVCQEPPVNRPVA